MNTGVLRKTLHATFDMCVIFDMYVIGSPSLTYSNISQAANVYLYFCFKQNIFLIKKKRMGCWHTEKQNALFLFILFLFSRRTS